MRVWQIARQASLLSIVGLVSFTTGASSCAPARATTQPTQRDSRQPEQLREPESAVFGSVVDEHGQPCPRCQLYLMDDSAGQWGFDFYTARASISDCSANARKGILGLFSVPHRISRSTDESGSFRFQQPRLHWLLIATDAKGYSAIEEPPAGPRGGSLKVELAPWATIDGTMLYLGKPARAGELVYLEHPWVISPTCAKVLFTDRTTTDSNGHFHFSHVPAGEIKLVHEGAGALDGYELSSDFVQTTSGKKLQCTVGAREHAVFGSLEGPQGFHWVNREASMTPVREFSVGLAPPDARQQTVIEQNGVPWTAEGLKAWHIPKAHAMEIQGDGRFAVNCAAPGEYFFQALAVGTSPAGHKVLGCVVKLIDLRDTPGQKIKAPTDLGRLTYRTTNMLRAGSLAPALRTTSINGAPIDLAALRGRYVLLHFWTSRFPESDLQLAQVRKLAGKYGPNGKLAVVSLDLFDAQADVARIAAHLDWPNCGAWAMG